MPTNWLVLVDLAKVVAPIVAQLQPCMTTKAGRARYETLVSMRTVVANLLSVLNTKIREHQPNVH